MSPNEMTVDPTFDFNNNLADVSNIHDLTDRTDLYPDYYLRWMTTGPKAGRIEEIVKSEQ